MPYRINESELMYWSHVCTVVKISMSVDVPKGVLIKTYYKTEIILHSYIKQHRSFGLSNITHIMRISTADWTTKLIAIVKGTSSYIAYWGPRYVEFCPLLNNKSTPLSKWTKTPMTIKTLQSGRHIFRSRHAGTITINVGMLESIHQLRKLNKWTLIVYLKL